MIECKHCESLIPVYYIDCPVCGTKLDPKNRIRFKQPKFDKDSETRAEPHLNVIHSNVEDFMANDTESNSI
jgi:hypothetical protein